MTTNDYSAEIAALEQLLNSATQSVSVDGLSTTFNLDKAKERLADLKRKTSGADRRMVKPRMWTADLGNSF